MSAPAPRRAAASQAIPLTGHLSAGAIAAYRRGQPVTAAQLLHDVARVAEALPEARHVLNGFTDRYLFAVALCAAVVRGQVTLMPASTAPGAIAALRDFAPDVYCVGDEAQAGNPLPRFALPALGAAPGGAFSVPAIPADQVVACLFTSGTTGAPRPNFKTWGTMVRGVLGGARRFGVGPDHAILGTVPPQHMFGFECAVMLPLAAGAALTAERPYFPADIDAAIGRVPAPRVLITTPFHLKTWMESGEAARVEMMVSATAPLSAELARTVEERTGATLHEIYGSTETGQIATRRPAAGNGWQALDGVRFSHQDGEAVVRAAHLEGATALHDVIELLDEGTRFLLHGRSADMVNIAGKRSSLAYLDHQLTTIEGVADGVFFLPQEAQPGEVARLAAFAVAPGLSAERIVAALRERIDPAFLPRPLYLVDALPRLATGKLPRAALLELARKARGGAAR